MVGLASTDGFMGASPIKCFELLTEP